MLDLLLSLAVLGVTLGSMNALIAVSFSIIYNVTHIFHLAHGASFTVGAYLIYWLATVGELPLIVAVGGSLFLVALFGIAIELGLYRPLRRAKALPMILFLGSFGILIIVEGLAGLLFGTQVLRFPNLPVQQVSLGPVSITTANAAMLVSWVLIAGVIVYLARSRSGRLLRAVGDSSYVATAMGIPLNRYVILSFALGSAFVVPAAFLYGWSQGLTPGMGLNAVLIGAAASIIGGRHGLLPGAIVALGLGVMQAMLVAVVPTGWNEGFTFAVLLVALLVRPQGIFGYGLKW